jgi:hypothetical protein
MHRRSAEHTCHMCEQSGNQPTGSLLHRTACNGVSQLAECVSVSSHFVPCRDLSEVTGLCMRSDNTRQACVYAHSAVPNANCISAKSFINSNNQFRVARKECCRASFANPLSETGLAAKQGMVWRSHDVCYGVGATDSLSVADDVYTTHMSKLTSVLQRDRLPAWPKSG